MFEGGEPKGAVSAAAEGMKLTCMLGHTKASFSGLTPLFACSGFLQTLDALNLRWLL